MTEVETQFPTLVRSAPVTMINFNVTGDGFVPAWGTAVSGHDRFVSEKRPSGEASTGCKLDERQRVDMSHVLGDLAGLDIVPIRLVIVNRAGSPKRRMALVCVQRDKIKTGECRLEALQEREMRLLMRNFLWDNRLYRNINQFGGNFVIDAGNPRGVHRASALTALRVSKGNEFEFGTVSTPALNAEAKGLARQLQKR